MFECLTRENTDIGKLSWIHFDRISVRWPRFYSFILVQTVTYLKVSDWNIDIFIVSQPTEIHAAQVQFQMSDSMEITHQIMCNCVAGKDSWMYWNKNWDFCKRIVSRFNFVTTEVRDHMFMTDSKIVTLKIISWQRIMFVTKL